PALPLEGPAHGQPAVHRHGVDLEGALVGRREGERLAVRRDRGTGLLRRMGGQPRGGPSPAVHPPEVPLGGEDDGVPMDGGKPVIAERLLGAQGTGEQQEDERENPSYHWETSGRGW